MTGLPILCDMVGFASLTLAVLLIGRFGSASIVGVIATLINFIFNPAGVHFLGFTVAGIVYDFFGEAHWGISALLTASLVPRL